MVELKQLELTNKSVLGIQLLLPNITAYVIIYKHHILCDKSLNLDYILNRSPNVSVMQVDTAHSFHDLLSQKLVYVSPRIKRANVLISMKGKDALEALP